MSRSRRGGRKSAPKKSGAHERNEDAGGFLGQKRQAKKDPRRQVGCPSRCHIAQQPQDRIQGRARQAGQQRLVSDVLHQINLHGQKPCQQQSDDLALDLAG